MSTRVVASGPGNIPHTRQRKTPKYRFGVFLCYAIDVKIKEQINHHTLRRLGYTLGLIGIFIIGTAVGKVFIPEYISVEYLNRIILNGDSETTDWKNVFPQREIANDTDNISALPTANPENSTPPESLTSAKYTKAGETLSIGEDVEKFLNDSKTDSLIITKNNQIAYENYLQGTNADTIRTSMSAAKSYLSALVGIAIHERHITSIDEPVVRYLPELRGHIDDAMTVKHLLTMTAGNSYQEIGGLTGDDTKTYWSPNLRQITLDYFRSAEKPGTHMQYSDFQPQVMGMILERTTGKSISQYAEEKLWKPAGMEHSGSWSLDSEEHGFEQSAVGVNATSRDFARFGLLFLNEGMWNDKQIIPKAWVTESTQADQQDASHFVGWHDSNSYGYYWWGNERTDGEYDYYARGKYGQFIYVSPSTQTVIVRTGPSTGGVQAWPKLFEQIAR